MPEIKHNFTGGKMNKDLDERLVPNGEYRDAMNIQVSTSEGSDVGTIQNILGNELGCSSDITPVGSVTVGSVSDEKNDSLYWLVAGPSLEEVSLTTLLLDSAFDYDTISAYPYLAKDMIMRRTNNGCEPVLVDRWATVINNYDGGNGVYYWNNDDNKIIINDPFPGTIDSFLNYISAGMSVYGVNANGTIQTPPQIVTSVGNLHTFQTPYTSGSIQTFGGVTQNMPWPMVKFPAVHDGVINYVDAQGVVIITNFTNLNGGVQIGDEITSFGATPSNTGVDLPPGTLITAILGIEMFGIVGGVVTPMIAVQTNAPTTPFSMASPPQSGAGVLSDNFTMFEVNDPVTLVTVNPEYLNDSYLTLQRATQPLTNTITLPPNSVWLNEISSVFWDEFGVAIPAPPPLMIDTDPYGGPPIASVWSLAVNGACIDPTTVDAPGVATNTGNDGYDNVFGVIDCLTGAGVIPSSNAGSMSLSLPLQQGTFGLNTITLDGKMDLSIGYDFLVFSKERVLNFSPSRMITGLNIVDDMLFWVDGKEDLTAASKIIGTEPKKINIKRSVTGTDPSGNFHTELITDATSITGPALKEEHITVIRNAPKSALSFDLVTDRELGQNYSGIMKICSSNGPNISSFTSTAQNRRDFNGLEVGDKFRITMETDVDADQNFLLPWEVGTIVVLKEFDSGIAPPIPFSNNEYRIMGVISSWTGNKFSGTTGNPAQVAIKITSIVGFPPQTSTTLNYAVDTHFDTEKLFEFKFPRFSYRYKYRDGEISTYAPFTSVAFRPGNFDYHPTKGYNLGMTNIANELVVKGFVTQDIPDDVIAIDLLYKEDASPNVYVIDTVKPNDQIPIGSNFNNWDNNTYRIVSDTIHSAVASNQLLRQWDNVPRKALSQEVTGNRIIYGNYLQNYDLTINNKDFYPEFLHHITGSKGVPSIRSVKSLRDYQLGVVFTDKYGRETPVISNSSAVFKVPKSLADSSNAISVGFSGAGPPMDLEYFKFFIKETSGEYYNMAMDRFFDAEDGNYWLSFPSSDRNKIDEDTFLILKKGHNSKELVGDKARYKVLAIENEAPDFIKTSHYNIGQVKQVDSNLFTSLINAPTETKDYFNILADAFVSGSASNLHEIDDPLYVEFGVAGSSKVSIRYRVTEITKPADDWGGDFNVKIDGTFGNDVNIISNGAEIIEGAIVRFYKYQVENKAIFDGRFFVKILNDDVFKKNITTEDIGDKEYIVSAEKKVYFMSEYHMARHHGNDNDSSVGTFGANSNINKYMYQYALSAFQNINYAFATSSASTTFNWYAYEAYFKNKFYTSEGNGSLHTKHRGEGLGDGDYTGGKIFEDVLFIDKGHSSGNHGHSGPFRFYQPNNANATQGIGVAHINDYGRMDLSFGSLEPEENTGIQYSSGSLYYTDSWETNWLSGGEGENFWNLTSTDREKYNHLAPIYDKITSGQQFRWKEDPTQTVYTIERQVDNYNIVRFDNTTHKEFIDVNGSLNSYYKERDSNGIMYSTKHGTPYTLASNFQQKKRFYFTPAMTSWDPTEQDSLGPISGGAYVDKYITDWGDPTLAANQANISIGLVISTNEVRVGTDAAYNSYDTVNDVAFGLEGMILTHVAGTALATPVLVDEVVEINNVFTTITFKGYKGTSGDIVPTPSNGQSLTFQQPSMNGLSVNSANNISDYNIAQPGVHGIGAIGYTMEFIEVKEDDDELSANPAIWETEPKESTDLDIYYEISDNNAISLTPTTIKTVLPVGSKVSCEEGVSPLDFDLHITDNNYVDGRTIRVNHLLCVDAGGCTDNQGNVVVGIVPGVTFSIERPNGTMIDIEVAGVLDIQNGGVASKTFRLKKSLYNTNYVLDWYNCYAFGNGVESNRIRDNFNLPYITSGVKASTTFEDGYKEEHRKYGLIYSGIYNSNSGINNLNQFIQAEKITKDINPIYGSIQKLHSRSTADGDLIVLCEDRILKILAEKDALYNADGNPQLIASNNVLGQATPFGGNYGISKNPESFASESYRVYFTDKVRGAVIRLSKDGLTAISDHGMKDWFRDNLKLNNKLIGSHDDKKNEYNITLKQVVDSASYPEGRTVSFREDVKGWVSFKSFTPENAISCANEYYTFKNGKLWLHHVEQFTALGKEIGRNTFYNIFNSNNWSTFNVILNEMPGSVKSFNTINYEGSQSKINQFRFDPITGLSDGEYYNLHAKEGWYVDSMFTNKEFGTVDEFIQKEGKWFNYIKGKEIQLAGQFLLAGETLNPKPLSNFDLSSLSIQGLGRMAVIPPPTLIAGCTDPTAWNYDSNAGADDGSCIPFSYGCINPTATNFDDSANSTNGSCVWEGCTDPTALNYDATATFDDGSCIDVVLGCTDNTQFNYNGNANTDNGNCIPFSYGCTDATQFNYDASINTDDGSCIPFSYGCNDATYIEYDSAANTDDGSCTTLIVYGCTDSTALNETVGANTDDGSCTYPIIMFGCTDPTASNFNSMANTDNNSCTYSGCTDLNACNTTSGATIDDGSCEYASCLGCIDPTAFNYDTNATINDGSCTYTVYGCTDPTACNYYGSVPGNTTLVNDSSCILPDGCTDSNATNYDASATCDDGSCTYPPLAIGDPHEGGIVFYLDGNGGGMVASLTDQSSGSQWGCVGTAISGANGNVIGSGAQNTLDIVAGCNEVGAAALCNSYTNSGYSDWYLPSKDEALEMYDNIGQGAPLNSQNTAGDSNVNIGGFTTGIRYWTSSEAGGSSEPNFAKTVNQDTGTVVAYAKFSSYPLRAARSF